MLASFSGGPAFADREFGIAVSGSPTFDFNRDGFRDLVVGEQRVSYGPFVSAQGRAWVFSGSDASVLWSTLRNNAPGYSRPLTFGYSVAALGDFNGDGFDDVAVGNPSATGLLGPGAGEVLVASGRDGGTLLDVLGTSSWDYLGYSVAGVGDASGDNVADLLIGCPLGPSAQLLVARTLGHG